MSRFKVGDLIRRKHTPGNGEYIGRVLGHNGLDEWVRVEVEENISGPARVGAEYILPEHYFTLERPSDDHVWTIREASETLGREKAEVEKQLEAARAHIKRLEVEVARVTSYASPRSILIVLSPPGQAPSSSPGAADLRLFADAEMVLAVSADGRYTRCLKNRYGSTDDVQIKVRWER
jgi:hypothetical protein